MMSSDSGEKRRAEGYEFLLRMLVCFSLLLATNTNLQANNFFTKAVLFPTVWTEMQHSALTSLHS